MTMFEFLSKELKNGFLEKIKLLETNLTLVKGKQDLVSMNDFRFRTCDEMRRVIPRAESGYYWIDPDGLGVGDKPIYVYCNMTNGNS